MEHAPELSVLQPIDPAITDSDDWPIFALTNASVHHADDQPANLLHACAQNPLVIRGNIEPVTRSNQHLFVNKGAATTRRGQKIELSQIRQFAYGQYDDGSVEIWAAGEAGWFAIKPSRMYRGLHQEMIEAVELLYFAADLYTNTAEPRTTESASSKRKRAGKPKSGSAGEGPDILDVVKRLTEAWPRRAPTGEDALAILNKHHWFLLSSMVAGKERVDWTKTHLYLHLDIEFPGESKQLKQLLLQSTPKPKRKSQGRSPQGGHDTVEAIDSTAVQKRAGTSRRNSAIVTADAEVRPKQRRGRSSLLNGSTGIETPIATPPSTRMADSGDEDTEDSSIRHRKRGRKGKSALRPKPSKYVAKQSADSIVEKDDREDEIFTHSSPTNKERRKSNPRRKSQNDVSGTEPSAEPPNVPPPRARQAVAGAQNLDEGIDMPLDEEPDLDANDNGQIDSETGFANLPFRLPTHLKAPHDDEVWTCPLAGCTHRVEAASDPVSQRLIKVHYRSHVADEDASARLQLVRRMEAPGLPLNRLLGRIQMLSGKGQESGAASPLI